MLPETTRQFLRPLIGIDPASVQVFRGAAAARLTAAQGADALTVGEHVLLADGQSIDGPRGVALLAHELTHVARARLPRFVPPVAPGGPSVAHASVAPAWEATPDGDDEAVAGRVERAVQRAATSGETGSTFDASPVPIEASAAAAAAAEPAAWGDLPAPWEPLPEWLTSPSPGPTSPSDGPTSPHAPSGSGPGTTEAASASPPVAPGGGDGGGPPVHAAAHGRDLQADDGGERVTNEPQPHHEERAVEPDLDALARQVYTLLRRRLASEQRRFG